MKNSLIVELASELAEERIKNIHCVEDISDIMIKGENGDFRFKEDDQDTFNDYYDDYYDIVYKVLNLK